MYEETLPLWLLIAVCPPNNTCLSHLSRLVTDFSETVCTRKIKQELTPDGVAQGNVPPSDCKQAEVGGTWKKLLCFILVPCKIFEREIFQRFTDRCPLPFSYFGPAEQFAHRICRESRTTLNVLYLQNHWHKTKQENRPIRFSRHAALALVSAGMRL